jgi:hypothetical protein
VRYCSRLWLTDTVLLSHVHFGFSTSDESFVRANFPPVLFDYLPWQLWTPNYGITKELADLITVMRPYGTAALEIANDRNRLLTNR